MAVTDVWADWSSTAASNTPLGTATPEIDDELRNVKAQCKGNAVTLSGDQTIAGVKTFSSIPVLPASNPSAVNQAVRASVLQTQACITVTAGGTGDVLTATMTPTLAAYAAGQLFTVKLAADNTGAATINIDSLGAKNIKKRDNTGALIALVSGDLKDGQEVLLMYDGTQFVLLNPSPPASSKLAGDVEQMVYTGSAALASSTTSIPFDDTIPQKTEGEEWLTLSITPKSGSNHLVIMINVQGACYGDNRDFILALFQDDNSDAICARNFQLYDSNFDGHFTLVHVMDAGTINATTFKVRFGCSVAGSTAYINGNSGGRVFGGVCYSTFTIMEIKV